MGALAKLLFSENRWNRRGFALVHALLLVLLSLSLMNRSVTYGDESFILKWISILERVLFEESDKPDPSGLLFINIAYDTQPLPHYSEQGFPIGSVPITNRAHLATLFSLLADSGSRHRYVVCDITFEDSADAVLDSTLADAIARLDRAVFPTHRTYTPEGPAFVQNIFPTPTALADYIPDSDGNFLKFSYVEPDTVSLPVHLFYHLDSLRPRRVGPFYWLKGRLWLTNFIPEMRLRNYDLFPPAGAAVALPEADSTGSAPEPYTVYPLAEIVDLADLLGPEGFHPFTEDRIVVIGDFNYRDVHQTFYGEMGGTIILLNAYWTLVHGDNLISWGFILLMLLVYYRLSLTLLGRVRAKGRSPVVRLWKTRVGRVIVWVVAAGLRTYFTIIETVEEVFSPDVLSRQQLLEVPSKLTLARLLIARGEMVLLLALYFVVAFLFFAKPVNFILLIIYLSLVDFLLRYMRYTYKRSQRAIRLAGAGA